MSRSSRDPRQVRFLTIASLRWIVRNRAWSWFYLVRYWRLMWLRLRHPQVVLTGLVFIGKGVRIEARRGYGRIIIGRWVHLGEGVKLRAHEGTLRIGDKTVFGQYTTVNAYLDIEIGARGLISDWIYVGDFDHVHSDIHLPIKDQGIVKAPVRIGPDCWIGVKATVLRGTVIGHGSVVAANSVAKGEYPPESVIAGVPARVIKDRRVAWEADAQRRRDVADIARKIALAAGSRAEVALVDAGVADPDPALVSAPVSVDVTEREDVARPALAGGGTLAPGSVPGPGRNHGSS